MLTLLIVTLRLFSFSALQTTQPPKVLFPPERQDTVIETMPGKDQLHSSVFLFFSLRGNPSGPHFENVSIFGAKCLFLWYFFKAWHACALLGHLNVLSLSCLFVDVFFALSRQRWSVQVSLQCDLQA